MGEEKGAQDGIVKEKEAMGLVKVIESQGVQVFEEAIKPESIWIGVVSGDF